MDRNGDRGKEFICNICGWDARKKSRVKNLTKALAGHKNSMHGRHGGTSERSGRNGEDLGRGFEETSSVGTRMEQARLRGELRILKKRIHILPRESREDAVVEIELINEHLPELSKSKNPSEDDLEEIRRIIEDDLRWAVEAHERKVERDERKRELKKDSSSPLEKFYHIQYQNMKKEYEIECLRERLSEHRERRNATWVGKQENGSELNFRTLPNGQVVKMTDKDYANWSLQHEIIRAKRKIEKDVDKVEIIWDDGKGGKPVPIKVSSEAFFRWAQGSGANRYSEVKELRGQYQKGQEFGQKRDDAEELGNMIFPGKLSDSVGELKESPRQSRPPFKEARKTMQPQRVPFPKLYNKLSRWGEYLSGRYPVRKGPD